MQVLQSTSTAAEVLMSLERFSSQDLILDFMTFKIVLFLLLFTKLSLTQGHNYMARSED